MRPAALILGCALLALGCEGTVDLVSADGAEVSWADGTFAVGDGTGVATPKMVSDGAELYTLYCESCHGPDAMGGSTWPGSIQGYQPIDGLVDNGRATMPALSMDGGEVALIQAYLLSFGAPDWSELSGAEIYEVGCASCHGVEAEGTDRGPQLRFRDAAYFDFVTRNGGWLSSRWDSPMVAFGSDRISDAQMAQMIGWIDSPPNSTTAEGLYHQFCANCHGGTGVPGRFAPEFEDSVAGVSRSGKEDSVSNRSYMPGWSSAEIDDSEMQLIQGFINGGL